MTDDPKQRCCSAVRRVRASLFLFTYFFVVFSFGAVLLFGQGAVWTAHYDNQRTGANVYEGTLTPDNVKPGKFGKLGSMPVAGCVYAQLLYASGVGLQDGRTRNLVFISTTTNDVYAFDADD